MSQGLSSSLLLTSHYLKCGHLVTPSYKQGWKFKSVIISHVPRLHLNKMSKRRAGAVGVLAVSATSRKFQMLNLVRATANILLQK